MIVEAPGIEPRRDSTDLDVARRFSDLSAEPRVQTSPPKCAESGEPGDSQAKPASPRAAALLHLLDGLRVALLGGDPEAALVLHETIGVLLRQPTPVAISAEVVDLAAERARCAER